MEKSPTSSPLKLIDIDAMDAVTLMGLEVNGPSIPNDIPIRKRLFSWLLDPAINGNYRNKVEFWIGILIVGNLFALVLEHIPVLYEPYQVWFHAFDIFSVAIFVLEYGVRLYLAPEDQEFLHKSRPRTAYVLSPFAIIDFLAVAPFFLQALVPMDLRALRLLRLLRFLKLFRILIPAVREFKALNRGRTFRQKIHALVFQSPYGGKMHTFFDTFIAVWVIISVISVVLESVHSISYWLTLEFMILDTIAVAIFTLEYGMRLYACVEEPGYKNWMTGRIKHAKQPSSLVDLAAIAPFFIEMLIATSLDLRFLRAFRLARLLKLARYNDSTVILTKVLKREWPVIRASAFVMLLLVVLTASLGYVFEHRAQPDKFDNIPNSIYWAVVTLASVGYGDISPVTPIGRAMTVVLALIGIGIFAIPAALLASAFSDQLHKERVALKASLRRQMKDGQLEESEVAALRTEAKRLHLTVEELNVLLEEVHNDRIENQKKSVLPLHVIAEHPAQAVEHYKALMGQIHQLSLLTDAAQFESIALARDRLTASELAFWQQLQSQKRNH